jgi:hypothetical protein
MHIFLEDRIVTSALYTIFALVFFVEDYNMKKQEERIKVNGIDYKKTDLENLSKAIMESCKVTRKKFRKEDSKYSHSGNGKLMFTNGLTLKEFEKKYHIKP